jgi:hypothetical protein
MSPLTTQGLLSIPLSLSQGTLAAVVESPVDVSESGTWASSPTSETRIIPQTRVDARLFGPLEALLPAREERHLPSLAELFGEIGSHGDIRQVGRFLESSGEERRRTMPPTLSRLRQVRDRLAARPFATPREVAARDAYVQILTRWQDLPSREQLQGSVERLVPLSNEGLKALWSINDLALSGLYAAAVVLPEGLRPNISRFLSNRMVDAFPGVTVEGILETMALMADRRVKGFANVFVPREFKRGLFDRKFLSSEPGEGHRIPSLLAECREALRIANHPAVVGVVHDRSFAIDWGRLTREESAYIRKRIERDIHFPFRCQHDTSVDIFYQMDNGHRRIVEVKMSHGYLDFRDEDFAKELLQVFRHALLARLHKMEGVEYVLYAPRFANRVIVRIKEILDLTGTNYVLYLRRPNGGETQVIERGMKHLGGEMSVPTERRYPFVL